MLHTAWFEIISLRDSLRGLFHRQRTLRRVVWYSQILQFLVATNISTIEALVGAVLVALPSTHDDLIGSLRLRQIAFIPLLAMARNHIIELGCHRMELLEAILVLIFNNSVLLIDRI